MWEGDTASPLVHPLPLHSLLCHSPSLLTLPPYSLSLLAHSLLAPSPILLPLQSCSLSTFAPSPSYSPSPLLIRSFPTTASLLLSPLFLQSSCATNKGAIFSVVSWSKLLPFTVLVSCNIPECYRKVFPLQLYFCFVFLFSLLYSNSIRIVGCIW